MAQHLVDIKEVQFSIEFALYCYMQCHCLNVYITQPSILYCDIYEFKIYIKQDKYLMICNTKFFLQNLLSDSHISHLLQWA